MNLDVVEIVFGKPGRKVFDPTTIYENLRRLLKAKTPEEQWPHISPPTYEPTDPNTESRPTNYTL